MAKPPEASNFGVAEFGDVFECETRGFTFKNIPPLTNTQISWFGFKGSLIYLEQHTDTRHTDTRHTDTLLNLYLL